MDVGIRHMTVTLELTAKEARTLESALLKAGNPKNRKDPAPPLIDEERKVLNTLYWEL